MITYLAYSNERYRLIKRLINNKIVWKRLLILLLFFPIILLVSCSNVRLPEYENEYFKYAIKTPKTFPKFVYIIGLTDLGKQQKYLILPHEIDGMKVKGIGYGDIEWFTKNVKSYFESDNLIRLYIDYETFVDEEWHEDYKTGSMANIPNCYVVYNARASQVAVYNKKGRIRPFYPPADIEDDFSNDDILANISFLYNYWNSPKKGIYWIDSYDNSLVEYIPPDPERDDYTFAGWFKESECINEFNFAIDKTNDVIINTLEGRLNYSPVYVLPNGLKK